MSHWNSKILLLRATHPVELVAISCWYLYHHFFLLRLLRCFREKQNHRKIQTLNFGTLSLVVWSVETGGREQDWRESVSFHRKAPVLSAVCVLPRFWVAWCRWLEIRFWQIKSVVWAGCWCSSFWAEVLCDSLEEDRTPKPGLWILPGVPGLAHAGVWLPVWLGLMHWTLLYLEGSTTASDSWRPLI